ncbi:pleckstrin homology-like domain family B member 1 isoform X4 [Dendroctonus ponderosae]|uniref:PH domain-containing protein n=1 Tax=Dendroctonus ponderosae TaxID=77166 RepID=A0AAR5NXR4_DENPD|nr:pleckstrin homology-like domain family B member 1 isoform X4 [Dendroctonus ponderosae]
MSGVTLAGGQPSGGNTDVGDGGGRALKLQTDTPHLVSMGGDRLSTSVTLHPLPPGRVTLGSGSGVDIPVQGTGVSPLHCHIENSEGVVTLYPLSDNLSIDGLKVQGPTRLSQGVMLTIGRSNYLRFNHPAEAKLMKSVLPNPRISMAPITFEPADMNYRESKLNKKPPVVPRKSPRESLSDSGSEEPPSSIMTKVSKFEYLAAQNLKKAYSPKVFTSNVPTMNVPVKDVLGKDIDSLSLRKSLPQSAVNYVELNTNEKQQNKIPDCVSGQTIFTKQKQPAYVNVTVNETRNINNRVIIYENGCIPKSSNVNFDHNDLNNKTATKNVNVNRANAPSPSFSRNPAQFYRSVTPSPISNNMKIEHRRSGSVGELPANYVEDLDSLASRKHEAEIRRNQLLFKAQRDRIKEQELEKAEKQRLEEILNMCAEYERQCQTQGEKSKPPTPNRIITNGSLPRDKRHLGSPFGSPPPSPLEILHNELLKQSNHNYENVPMNFHKPEPPYRGPYENVEIRQAATKDGDCGGTYENVSLQTTGSYPSSPRTRIKTFVAANKDGNLRSVEDSIDSKFAVFETERKLIKEAERVLRQNLHNSKEITDDNLDLGHLEPRKSTPTKFIYPMEGEETSAKDRQSSECRMSLESTKKGEDSTTADSVSFDSSQEYNRRLSASQSPEERKRWEQLRKEKRDILAVIARIRRQMNEIEIQEEELHREIELEKALINGEFKSKELELEKIESKKQKLQKRAQRIEDNMRDCQIKQEEDQEECKKKLQFAQDAMDRMEEKLKATEKTSSDYEAVFEEYLQAQEQLDNERKNFEDLEFHHLEEEADWLASREELQREISDLSNRIEHVKGNLKDLDSQKQKTSKTNSNEYKTIEKQKLECMVRLEEIRDRLKSIDTELMFSNQESDQEASSESDDSDKSKERPQSNTAPKITNMSCSMIVSNHNSSQLSEYNMSQSFNEKLIHETFILEDGMAKKFPSQDDIDRISKVTSDAPIIEEGRQSLGRKAIESLKEIERNRHLHLCQQGSQVIEQERQRVLALKQRVQEEVKSQWAQQRQDSVISSGSDSFRNSGSDPAPKPDSKVANGDENRKSKEDEVDNSPRPLSEISEMSVEVGGTLGKKRIKPISDKQRPLTRYLPIRGSDLDLRNHIETAGHQVVLCPHVIINSNTCRGFLHKKGSKLNGWSRRWFVFDRNKHTLTYYTDKSEKKARGGAYFQAIEEVYLDHLNTVKSPNPQLTFIVKTHERLYHLMAPSPEAMRIWVDVIFTGAEGYREFEHGT